MNQQLLPERNPVRPMSKAFYTDLNQQSEIEEEGGRLRKYVDQIEQKIDYAKWKQDLVLKFNYMPMKRITEKAQNQKFNYLKRINQEEELAAKMLSGKEITVQLDLFRQFSKQLKQKTEQLLAKIIDQKKDNEFLLKKVQQKRKKLKQKMKDNMQTIKQSLQKQGISNKEDIIVLFRSKSMKGKFQPSPLTSRTQAVRKISERGLTSERSKRENSKTSLKLFEQCLNQLIASISLKSKGFENIESQIHTRKDQKFDQKISAIQKVSTKSKILETLYSQNKSSQIKLIKTSQKVKSGDMDWETFKNLGFKDMLNLVLEYDRTCQKLRKLMKKQ